MTKDSADNRKYISAILDTFPTPNFNIRKELTTRSQEWKITKMQRILYGESTCKEMPEKEMRQHPRPVHPRQDFQKGDD